VRLSLQLGEAIVHDLRSELFHKLQTFRMGFYNRTKLGRIISRFTSDTEAIRRGVQQVLFVTLVGAGQMLVAAAIMAWKDWQLFLVLLALAPVLYAFNQYFRKRLGDAYRAVQESFSRVTATLAESVSGIRVTQGFVRQEVNAGLFEDLVRDHAEYNLGVARNAGVFLPMLEMNSQFFVSALLVLGAWKVLYHGHSPEPVIAFLLLAPNFFGPITALGNQYNQALAAMAGAERVFRILDLEPDWQDPPDAVKLTDVEGRVEFRDLSFEYEPDKPVLREMNFVAEPGQTVALVGHTGSGKTTLINLIAKFYLPTAGQILFDGQDMTRLETRSLRDHVGIVLQQNFLFTGSVMDNIRVGKPDATNLDIIRAAQRLDGLDLFDTMPEGLLTHVGEGGSGLSLGQRQLVCFTRAMLADPAILILDEATSSVDTVTEARIQNALDVLLRNRTSFVVAHRLSTIRHADVVLVLDHGRIVEQGSHDDLLRQGGVYANLYKQFIRASAA
jgi:ATP-binding cassette subfamily B protein